MQKQGTFSRHFVELKISLKGKKSQMSCDQSALLLQCSVQSVGTGAQLFLSLIQMLIVSQCAISPEQMWPRDYGKTAVKEGKINVILIIVFVQESDEILVHVFSEHK